MFKTICLMSALAFGSYSAVGVAPAHAAQSSSAESDVSESIVEPGDCDYDEEEMEVMPDTDGGVVKIFEICKKGIFWYEAEDADGNRFKITEVTWGNVDKGVVDFGDGAGGRYCEWR